MECILRISQNEQKANEAKSPNAKEASDYVVRNRAKKPSMPDTSLEIVNSIDLRNEIKLKNHLGSEGVVMLK